jgi:hypothetical protein
MMQTSQYGSLQGNKEDKSFTSPGGTHGAVSALNLAGAGLSGGGAGVLDSSMVNLSTPSSSKSKSGISIEDSMELRKQ